MTHGEFVAACASGRIQPVIDAVPAGKFVSARMMLPFFLLPLFGLGVGLALLGAWWWAALAMGGAYALRLLVRATAPRFVLQRALADPGFYADALARGVLVIDAGPAAESSQPR